MHIHSNDVTHQGPHNRQKIDNLSFAGVVKISKHLHDSKKLHEAWKGSRKCASPGVVYESDDKWTRADRADEP